MQHRLRHHARGVQRQESGGLETNVFTGNYLPEAFPLDDPRKAIITLGQLLSMTAGYWVEGQNPTGYVKSNPLPIPILLLRRTSPASSCEMPPG